MHGNAFSYAYLLYCIVTEVQLCNHKLLSIRKYYCQDSTPLGSYICNMKRLPASIELFAQSRTKQYTLHYPTDEVA